MFYYRIITNYFYISNKILHKRINGIKKVSSAILMHFVKR